uniref:Uncharacterized protein n=1 Tax=Plectus sambesii TaxID=2011161 RepID=A0A914XCT3_9BILA
MGRVTGAVRGSNRKDGVCFARSTANMRTMTWADCLLLLLLSSAIAISSGLDCWKCVGPDCDDTSMEQSEFAERMTCEEGASCQKAWLEFYDLELNQSRTSITVRSCSYRIGCNEIIDTTDCKEDKQRYAGLGCETRYCCDGDLCNGVGITSSNTIALVTAVTVAIIFQLHRYAN